ncbi:PDDEXK nuclease domain-containing protein [Dolichospermum planctonicum UHCC 0167]|uniref:PDDEXK nuclease domain-containing protein n=1 Tax=Dolichospermum planctonicum TaxID=136072 RepID=UPI00144368CC|nr:PDDEXK nuclease domain-containing protein [Dolichospermum planctonicum]MCW9680164.1 PDDEXK nuclease domain-containing protein [Dolichospermum planctonicum UHCC 0167]
MNNPISDNYIHLLMEVKQRIRSAQYEALKAVNREMINLYWDIGQMIFIKQQNYNWGKSVVEQLSKDLQTEFPGISGFSARNIWNMRSFYVTYSQNEKLQPLVAEIGWTHNIVILGKCKDDLEREFYMKMTRKFGWTKNVLIHQIENQTYEKTLLNQTNFDQNISSEIRNQLKLAVKDEYTFDFLELADEHSERQLEQAILAKVKPFLQEMAGIFTFVDSQYRLEVDDEEYFIDILLYHRRLKCLVAIELKIGKFLPEYVGKMQFYLSVLDDKVKLPDENPSIGIILCKSKQRTIVEYALKDSNKPIGVATYQIVSQLPQELKNQLPDPEQVAKLLEGFA